MPLIGDLGWQGGGANGYKNGQGWVIRPGVVYGRVDQGLYIPLKISASGDRRVCLRGIDILLALTQTVYRRVANSAMEST
jgi:hypothetical protein